MSFKRNRHVRIRKFSLDKIVRALPTGDLNVFRLVLFESSSALLATDCVPTPPVELLRLLYIFCCLPWGESSRIGELNSDTELDAACWFVAVVEMSRDSFRFGGGGFGFLSFELPTEELVDWSELVEGDGEIDRELRI